MRSITGWFRYHRFFSSHQLNSHCLVKFQWCSWWFFSFELLWWSVNTYSSFFLQRTINLKRILYICFAFRLWKRGKSVKYLINSRLRASLIVSTLINKDLFILWAHVFDDSLAVGRSNYLIFFTIKKYNRAGYVNALVKIDTKWIVLLPNRLREDFNEWLFHIIECYIQQKWWNS
jgi:hypothetical protein